MKNSTGDANIVDINIQDFDFQLDENLIANEPTAERTQSKLLVIEKSSGACSDHIFVNIADHLCPGDLLIVNDTKVFPARVYGTKASGGKVELLAERVMSDATIKVQIKASKAPKSGTKIHLQGEVIAEVLGREEEFFLIKLDSEIHPLEYFERYGHSPLPPYIDRAASEFDQERYQTVYAKHVGAVAAPTAGLHFSDDLLKNLVESGVIIESITLHVGAGNI